MYCYHFSAERGGYRITAPAADEKPMPQEVVEAVNARRCASQGRGSLYDSAVGKQMVPLVVISAHALHPSSR